PGFPVNKDVTLTSPLLVNLLQSDISAGHFGVNNKQNNTNANKPKKKKPPRKKKNSQQDLNTADTRPAGLEEADQPPLPGEQGINLDNSGPKLPEFSNRPPAPSQNLVSKETSTTALQTSVARPELEVNAAIVSGQSSEPKEIVEKSKIPSRRNSRTEEPTVASESVENGHRKRSSRPASASSSTKAGAPMKDQMPWERATRGGPKRDLYKLRVESGPLP
ncbi:LOW QUALITY PROTEIN: NCOA6 isoform 3, partial [Pongo abelii]